MNKMDIPAFKRKAKLELAILLAITDHEAEAVVDRFMGLPNIEALESEMLDVLGFEEDALRITSFFIENSSTWLLAPPKTQQPVVKPKTSNLNQRSPEPARAYSSKSKSDPKNKPLINQIRPISGKDNLGDTKPRMGEALGYRKEDNELVYFQGSKKEKTSLASIPSVNQTSASINNQGRSVEANTAAIKEAVNEKSIGIENSEQKTNYKASLNSNKSQKSQKTNNKPKYVRKQCGCQALVHPLLTNCLNCGRIVCVMEGVGPCFDCEARVESRRQQLVKHIKTILATQKDIGANIDNTAELIYDLIDVKSKLLKAAETQKNKKINANNKAEQTQFSRYSSRVGGEIYTTTKEWVPVAESLKPKTSSQSKAQNQQTTDSVYVKTYLEQDEVIQKLESIEGKLINIKIKSPAIIGEVKRLFESENRKNRLLELDQISAQTTKIIDERSDFDIDSINRWMSSEEKTALERANAEQQILEEEAERNRVSGVRVLKLDIEKKTISFEREKAPEKPKTSQIIGNANARNEMLEFTKDFSKQGTKKSNVIKFKEPEIVLPKEVTQKTNTRNKKSNRENSSASRGLAKSLIEKSRDSKSFSEDFILKINNGITSKSQ